MNRREGIRNEGVDHILQTKIEDEKEKGEDLHHQEKKGAAKTTENTEMKAQI